MNNETNKDSKILSGRKLAKTILDEVAREVEELKKAGHEPFLMTLAVGDDSASRVYRESQRRVAKQVGINFETIELSPTTSQERILRYVDRVNRDPLINGLIVNLPLPEHINTNTIQWSIARKKDIEGVTPGNLGGLFLGIEGLRPCTALAILALIKSTGIEIKGKEVVIVGHSAIVGKPTALLLLQEDATVTVCHYATTERGLLEYHVRNAEILIVAVGKPGLIKGEWIKEGALVIDAGISNVNDKIVGDIEFESALERAACITPVPGGVGPVTTAYLMKNTIEALRWQLKTQN